MLRLLIDPASLNRPHARTPPLAQHHLQEWWPPYYGYNHSYWHTSTAVGVYFMIGVLPPNDQRLNLDSRIAVASRIAGTINDLVPLPRPKWLKEFRLLREARISKA